MDLVNEYWGKSEIGRYLLETGYISRSDLLFLIPNNKKRMYGLKPHRSTQRRCSAEKHSRKEKIIESPGFFLAVDWVLSKELSKKIDSVFDKMSDVNDVCVGEKGVFTCESGKDRKPVSNL